MRSYVHRGGDTPLIGDTIGAHLVRMTERFAGREAVVSLPQGRRLTYAALHREADDLARGLLGLGVRRGDRVGVWSTDYVEWVLLQVATARIGAVLVNINPAYRVGELEHALRLARVQVLALIPGFRSSRYPEILLELCPELRTQAPDALDLAALPDLRRAVIWDPDRPSQTARPAPGFTTWAEVLAAGAEVGTTRLEAAAERVDPDDPVNIQFTSGTTGFPKAVVLTHHGILNNGHCVGAALHFTEHDRLCVPVPFYHCFGMVVANLACLTHGAAIVIPAPHFDAGATLAAIESERCTAVHGVPTMFVAELEHPDLPTRDLSSLRTGVMAGAPCPPALVRAVMEDVHCPEILIGYGLTETSPVTHLTHPGDDLARRVETVGTNLPHQEVKIVDPDHDRTVPVGTPGEVCFRGYHVMRGYFEQPDATAEVLDYAGWLHSGDLGVLDGDGYLRITGRLKDMIIRGGENIYPAEIEAHLLQHPDIAEAAVFGVPDKRWGEDVGAWIRLHAGATLDAESFREWARLRMSHYKVPRQVRFVDEFPMTVTGKIRKFRIREIVAAERRAVAAEADGEDASSRSRASRVTSVAGTS